MQGLRSAASWCHWRWHKGASGLRLRGLESSSLALAAAVLLTSRMSMTALLSWPSHLDKGNPKTKRESPKHPDNPEASSLQVAARIRMVIFTFGAVP